MNLTEFKNLFENCEFIDNKIIVKNNILNVLKFIKENYSYKILKEIIANDKQNEGIELIYHLYSIDDEEDLFFAIIVQGQTESVTEIFSSAIFDEREIYDMFGINFIGHKNLQRLYMPDSWQGYPLKKDYIQEDERLAWNDNNDV